jgi:4-hydroxythreonine-4-phosphate dehydrogenase
VRTSQEKQPLNQRPKLALTLGDPSGIGPEVVAKALKHSEVRASAVPFVVGTVAVMSEAARLVGLEGAVRAIRSPSDASGEPGTIDVLNVDGFEETKFPVGKHSVGSARASHAWVERAARLCIGGEVDGMVTAPVNKESWHTAGFEDTGHQEVFKRLTKSGYVATMLVSGRLRCMHLSTHKSLREACDYVTRPNVLRAVRLTDAEFKKWGFARPRIAVAGLNPHASDNGLIGREELDEIAPAVADARKEGIDASGPVPADSVFNQAINGKYDVVVVMYHDQGHIAIKVHGFEESISVNLGIPFLRTSVDHGTAFDIAGKGVADETSMIEAIKLAVALATRRGIA